ncbi:hypothetical protein K8I31_18860 [bacterium]|nr:hypothetical protein [bacterium]
MAENLRQYIWEQKLLSELNVLYWTKIGKRIHLRDRWSKIFIAVLSSGAVASWLIADYPAAWKLLSSLTAITSIIISFMNWSDQIQKISDFRSNWIDVLRLIDQFLLEYEENAQEENLNEKIEEIRIQVDKIKKAEFLLPSDDNLKRKCYNKIISEHHEMESRNEE